MIFVAGYLFVLPIVLSPITTFAQILSDSLTNSEDGMNVFDPRQRYHSSLPYWRLDDDNANYIEFPPHYIERLERGMVRKPFVSTIIENQSEKRIPPGGIKDKLNNSPHYDGTAHSNAIANYEKRNSFRQLALNGARGFGK